MILIPKDTHFQNLSRVSCVVQLVKNTVRLIHSFPLKSKEGFNSLNLHQASNVDQTKIYPAVSYLFSLGIITLVLVLFQPPGRRRHIIVGILGSKDVSGKEMVSV